MVSTTQKELSKRLAYEEKLMKTLQETIQKLKTSEQKYKDIVEMQNDFIITFSNTGKILFANN